MTQSADGLYPMDAGDLFSSLVEGFDAPSQIHSENPVCDTVQYDLVMFNN